MLDGKRKEEVIKKKKEKKKKKKKKKNLAKNQKNQLLKDRYKKNKYFQEVGSIGFTNLERLLIFFPRIKPFTIFKILKVEHVSCIVKVNIKNKE